MVLTTRRIVLLALARRERRLPPGVPLVAEVFEDEGDGADVFGGLGDDEAVAGAALRHRLILGFEAQADNVSADRIVEDVLATIGVPRP